MCAWHESVAAGTIHLDHAGLSGLLSETSHSDGISMIHKLAKLQQYDHCRNVTRLLFANQVNARLTNLRMD